MHNEKSPLAGQLVQVKLAKAFHNRPDITEFQVQVADWQDRAMGGSWMFKDGNPAAMFYAMRAGAAGLPIDDEVLYTRDPTTGLSNLVHLSEIVQ
jgi:hypothetical protein